MRQKKFDYKNYKFKQSVSRRKRINKKKSFPIKGLISIFVIFILITVLLYYFLGINKTKESHELSKSDYHFIIINVNNPRDNKLISVIMMGYKKNTGKLILSYFPAKASLKQKQLINVYNKKKENGLLDQFQWFFNKKFYYLVLYDNLYEKVSRKLKKVILYSEKNKEIIVHGSILEKYDQSNNFFLIQGYGISKYMNPANKVLSTKTKHNRVLYSVLKLLSNGSEFVKAINNYGVISNMPSNKGRIFLDMLSRIRIMDIYSYMFSFREKGELSLKDSPEDYFRFIKSPTSLYPKASNKIRVKVIDSSGLGHLDEFSQSERKNFLVKVLNLDVSFYGIGRNIIDESYIVNLSDNLEMANYIKGSLKIKHIYNTANKPDQYYDILLVMGKDFPMEPTNN